MSVSELLEPVIKQRLKEINDMKGPILSLHEGYALALEELQEIEQELDQLKLYFNETWTGIKRDDLTKLNYYGQTFIHTLNRAERVACEAIDLIIVLERMKGVVR